MKKEMLINVLQPEEIRIAILEDGVLEELYVERTSHESYVGNIYKGRIVNIEPSIQAAFVDFGVGRNWLPPRLRRRARLLPPPRRRRKRPTLAARLGREDRGDPVRRPRRPWAQAAASFADDFDDLNPEPIPVDIIGDNLLESEPIDEDLLEAPLHTDEERSEAHSDAAGRRRSARTIVARGRVPQRAARSWSRRSNRTSRKEFSIRNSSGFPLRSPTSSRASSRGTTTCTRMRTAKRPTSNPPSR